MQWEWGHYVIAVGRPSCGREIFGKNREKMISEMMPMCREMMKSCNMDMQGMMKMMGIVGAPMGSNKH